MSADFH